MKSIAIWHKPIDQNSEIITDVELHFNLWKIPNGASKQIKFLDMGIKLTKTINIETLRFYFPFQIDTANFEDIVDKFINKADLVSAIFNENYKVLSTATSKLFEIKDINDKSVFDIYKTSTTDLTKENKYGGTIFNFKVPRQDKPIYFRFRITGGFIDSLCSNFKPTNAILESAFSEIEMIDFRVNEIRDLNQDLLELIKEEVIFKIKKQHFFFICSNEEEVIGNHQPYLSCRNLENYRWNDYVGLSNLENQIYLAYHWKDNDKDNVSILIKTKYEKNNWKTISKYVFFAFVIAVALELFSNWLYDLLK